MSNTGKLNNGGQKAPRASGGPPSEDPGGDHGADEAAEAAYYLETLKANRRLAKLGQPLQPGETHRIERDEKGREIVVRKRYSAF